MRWWNDEKHEMTGKWWNWKWGIQNSGRQVPELCAIIP